MPDNFPIIDVNITLGHWPTRRVALDEPQKLVAKLRQHNVIEAWAGSYDGLFHQDLTAVNNRLAEECADVARPEPAEREAAEGRGVVRLVPFGEINPLLPNWQAELDHCAVHHRMPGVRLHPNYHGYKLDHPEFARLLKAAADRNLIVQLAVLMEDERMMHPLMRVPPVDLTPLPALVQQTPGLRLILLNATQLTRNVKLARLINAGDVYCEIATLEGVGAIENLVTEVPAQRILFGSHTPSLYFESAILKLKESVLPAPHRRALSLENSRRLLAI